jgi:hypothetical protein
VALVLGAAPRTWTAAVLRMTLARAALVADGSSGIGVRLEHRAGPV